MKKIFVYIILGFLAFNFFANLIAKDETESILEKRDLQSFPDFSFEAYLNEDFQNEFNEYAKDQQVFRTELASINSEINYKVLRQSLNNGIYLENDSLYESLTYNEYNNQAFSNFVKAKIANIDNLKVCIIPDKSFYLESGIHLTSDDYQFPFAYLDLSKQLNANSFYDTDLHLNNEGAYQVYQELCKAYNLTPIEVNYQKIGEYYGYYARKAMYFDIADDFEVYQNDIIDNLEVEINGVKHKGYSYLDYLVRDPYSVNLSGNNAITTITNDNYEVDKTLVIIKDSYGLNIAPLLAQNFHKVILLDYRFLNDLVAKKYYTSEVLILYGYKSINDSEIG